MSLDELRAVVAGGDGAGVVARYPGLLAVAEGPDAAVERLLSMCRESAGPAPGRGLARRLAAWLGDDDGPPDGLRFGTVAETDRGLAVFLSGNVDLLVPDRGTALVGADDPAWTDRLIDLPDAPLALTLRGATAPADLVDGVYDLREGAVPGVALVALGATTAPKEPVLPVEPEVASPVVPQADVPADPPPDDVTEVVRLARHRRPDTGGQPVRARSVSGQRPNAVPTGDVVRDAAVRPPLGVLVFDDGTTHTVDAGFLLGREPEGDARVRAGVLRPIMLDDPSGAMSRVHAEIRVENREALLTDAGSSNGTFVAEAGAQEWTALAPNRPHRLVPGVRVQLGQRIFTFEEPPGPH